MWILLADVELDATGSGRMIIERRELATLPDAVQITLESAAASTSPSGSVVVAWPGS
jgi:hypothetical protein